jgi:hypothetical protein
MMAHPASPTTPITLSRWHVKRAGGRMTAYGTDIATGQEAKITNIDRLDPPVRAADHNVRATDKNGIEHVLTFAL